MNIHRKMRILILGGTSEANALASLVAAQLDVYAILSFAGRTKAPRLPPIPYRVGGFGGVSGLTDFLRAEKLDLLIDATHPFAEVISQHAVVASEAAQVPLITLVRTPWRAGAGDRWESVGDMKAAAVAIGERPQNVFLTIGRLQLAAFESAPQHFYLIRSIEEIVPAPGLPNHKVILGRGPFDVAAEETVLRDARIDVIVTKNSGGHLTHAKLVAARRLSLKVIMVERAELAAAANVADVKDAMELILRHQSALAARGV